MEQKYCTVCKQPLIEGFKFCPNCGAKVADITLSVTVGKQIGIYLMSALLPPMGLWPGIKYLRSNDEKTKKIGMAAIFLTIIASMISLWMTFSVVNTVSKTLNSQLNNQQLQGLGM